jgi:hypothetical protein
MKESTEQLLKDFHDVIDALRSKRCADSEFQERWRNKYRDVCERLDALPQDERDLLDAQYQRNFRERYGDKIADLFKQNENSNPK